MRQTFTAALSSELRAELARRGITGRELGRRMSALPEAGDLPSPATLARMLKGQSPWDVNTLELVARVLGLSVADLLTRAEAVSRCTLPRSLALLSSQVRDLAVPA